MICPKCNANLKDDSTYCVRCGETFNEKKEIINNPDEKKVPFDDLLRLYVGNKYDDFEDNPFSIWQFLFGFFYPFYRRHYSYGIFCIIIYILSNYLFSYLMNTIDLSFYAEIINNKFILDIFPKILKLLLVIAISFLLAQSYNKTYLKYSSTKVKNIMFSKKNYDAETQKRKCIKRGRPSIIYIFIFYGLTFFILFSISFTISFITKIKPLIEKSKMNSIANNICLKLEQEIPNYQITPGETKSISIIKDLKKYHGFFYISKDTEKIGLIGVGYDNIKCYGICGQDITCDTDDYIDEPQSNMGVQ